MPDSKHTAYAYRTSPYHLHYVLADDFQVRGDMVVFIRDNASVKAVRDCLSVEASGQMTMQEFGVMEAAHREAESRFHERLFDF